MSLLKIIILAVVQGLAELLPVSSSAHVVVAEKLMGLDPSSPEMTLLLVMLHTGTMFAVIAFFWKTWKQAYFSSTEAFKRFAVLAVWATLLTWNRRRSDQEGHRKNLVSRCREGRDRATVQPS